MSSGPHVGQAVGTMGWHQTTLSPWCGASIRTTAQRQDKTRQHLVGSYKTFQKKCVHFSYCYMPPMD